MHDEIQHPEDLGWAEFLEAMESEGAIMESVDARADMLLEALADLEREDERDALMAAERQDQVARWLERQRTRRDRRSEYLVALIEEIAAVYDFGRKKSRDLPNGVFGYRAKRATVEVVDKAAAVEWATVHCPAAVKERTSQEVTKTELVRMVESTGVHLDPATTGLRYVEGREDLYITPRTEK